MKIDFRNILTLVAVVTFSLFHNESVYSQGKIYHYEKGDNYVTLELDSDSFPTWGTYRAMHHHNIPYFEMTFLAQTKKNERGSELLVIVPTFYAYSYRHDVVGQGDTINMKKQEFKLYYYIKDGGKKLEYIAPDSIDKQYMLSHCSFHRKKHTDITALAPKMKLTKKPKWIKFPRGLRMNLATRFKEVKQAGFE